MARALVFAPALCAQQAGPLRAGAAKVDITPTANMFPIHQGPQTLGDVHDPLFARALVLDNGTSKILLMSVDTTGMPNAKQVVQAVSDELKIPDSHISIAITHDHVAPTFGGGRGNRSDIQPYLDLMLKGIVQAAREANANLQPARLGWGTGKAYVNTNRDEKIGPVYHMGYAPEGPTDKTVAVILVTGAEGKPIAIWSNYAVHGVVMFLTKTKNGMSEVSGDLPGWTARYVEEHFPGAVNVWTSGAAGDQNPLFQADYNQDGPDVHDEGAAGYAVLDVLSRRLGEAIVRAANNIQDTTDKAVLWGEDATVTCPGRTFVVTKEASAVAAGQSPTAGMAQGHMEPGPSVDIPLHLIMINDIALANVSGEVFTQIAQRLKQNSLFDRTAMVTLSNGSLGYIPSEAAYLLPSMMAVHNRIAPGCAESKIDATFLDLEKQYLPMWKAAN
jgi:Neutral/alkaline non-lysosomal ceramidase, N-terminal